MENLNLGTFGFDMYPVRTRDGSKVFAIDTPFRLADEFVFDIFVEQVGNYIHIFDEGSTVFDILSVGINMSGENNKFSSLKKYLESWNLSLSDSYLIEAYAPIEEAPVLFSKYTAGMMGLDSWLRNHLKIKPSHDNLVNETKTYFNTWSKGLVKMIDKPTLKDKQGKKHQFDLFIDNFYVDSIFPEHNASSGFMRKAMMAHLAGGKKTLAVIDDSSDKDKAEKERELIGVMSYAMTLSNLKRNAVNGLEYSLGRYIN